MLIEKRYFSEGCNGDIAPRLLSDKECLRIMNSRFAISEFGRAGRIENCPGTTLVTQNVLPPYGTHQCIGSVSDTEEGKIVYALWNSSGDHGIYCYYLATGITYAVLYDSQVDTGLNFSKAYRIDRNMKVVNGMLYWTEWTNNQPRKINIEAGIKANHASFSTDVRPYSFPISAEEITVIKKPPALAPNIQKAEDNTFENNFIYDKSFEFAFQFVYYDNETSVVGTYSPGSRLNTPDSGLNYISVVMDAQQQIPNTVRMVNLVVRQGQTTIANIIKVWDKEIASEAAEIASHNASINLLTFNYYGDIKGEAIAEDYVLKPFDNVPIYAYTLETAKNRLFFGNIISGYNTPTTTSLSYEFVMGAVSGSNPITKSLIEVRAKVGVAGPNNDYGYGGWYVYLSATDIDVPGYYLVNGTEKTAILNDSSWTYNPALDPPPTTTSILGLTYIGATQADVTNYIKGSNSLEGSAFYTRSNNIIITGIAPVTDSVFKSGAAYKIGIVFYDFAMRKCGVLTSDSLIASIPARTYDYSTAIRGIIWNLSNTNAVNEIPDWAYYYSVVITLNQTTRFFVESVTNAAKYATKDADGNYEFTNNTYVTNAVGIALNTTALVQSGLGYTFAQGGIAVLTCNDGNSYTLPVIAQDGNYIIVAAQNIGNLSALNIIYELYTPYQSSTQEPFYEIGQMYPVTNPTQAGRTYSVTSDIFLPDAYTITRSFETITYEAEAMSPNDLFYSTWYTDAGKPNFVTKLGQVALSNFIRWGNTYIPGTSINGLSTFEPLNQTNVPEDVGSIQKLQLTSKVQGEGTVMLAICRAETCSLYLGETQILDSTGATQFFSSSTGVIGTINTLKGSRGTRHPESVIFYVGLVLWYDADNGVFVQYSANGLEDVSRYKQTRLFKRYSNDYLNSSTGNIDNINGFHHIPTGIDPFTKEVLVTLPGLIYENYATTLPSYSSVPSYATSIIDRFDIYDQLAKTLSFFYEENRWGDDYEFIGEWYQDAQNILFGWKNGILYTFNTNTANYNTWFGEQFPVRICLTGNLNPSLLKNLFNISVESNAAPNFTVAMSNYPDQQITDLTSGDYVDQEGIFYAYFLRDRLSPNAGGTADQRLYTGDVLKENVFFIMLEFQQYDALFWMQFCNIGYAPARGQQQTVNVINQ